MFHGAFDREVCHDHIVGNVDTVDAARFEIINVAFRIKDFRHRHILSEQTGSPTCTDFCVQRLESLTPATTYFSGRPSSPSNAFTAALRAVRISASEPESHMRPKRPTDEMCRILMLEPFSASFAA